MNSKQRLEQFLAKENVRIVVTDSGLGGLSVAADLYERLNLFRVFKQAEVIFFNAQPHLDSGYNLMETTEQKVAVFENAMNAIVNEFRPDAIFIACNTLSVIYEQTQISNHISIPVISIVETGVDLIMQKMQHHPHSRIVLFATETTVGQGRHKALLLKKGISADKVHEQPCPDLAGNIERGVDRPETVKMVKTYVRESVKQLPSSDEIIFVSYNCTHYGYADKIFRRAFAEEKTAVAGFLNPNLLMADFMFETPYQKRYRESEVTVHVVSQAELIPDKLNSLFSLIEPHSPDTARALLEYDFVPDFFEWKTIAK